MKKIKVLLLILAMLLVVPFGVFADEATTSDGAATEESKEVKIYFFHGDGCGFCANAEAWFEEIEDEYGDKFEVVAYEVWYNEDNSKLMEAVGSVRQEEPGGVPYIIVGNQSWDGFADEYKDEILEKIDSEYEQDPSERYDIMNYVDLSGSSSTSMSTAVDTNTTRDALILLVVIAIGAAITVGVIVARKNTN